MNILLYPIFVPIIVGLLCLTFKRWEKELALVTSLIVSVISIFIVISGESRYSFILSKLGIDFSVRAYDFSSYLLLAVSIFTVLIVIYSFKFMEGKARLSEYYGNVLLTLGASAGALLANDLILLLVFWGITGLTLYMLINLGGEAAAPAAKKTFLIIGGTDALMIIGIGVIWLIAGTFQMDAVKLPIDTILTGVAYFCLAAAAFAKAGAIPLHTWIPDTSDVAPVPVMAYLPSALDKLLGIYLLARVSLDLFVIPQGSVVATVLLILGSATIIIGGMMAIIQNNFKKLFAYSTVSHVGYMVVGIGTGIPVAIAGALFHMLNHAIYKCCLFLSGGIIEKRLKSADLGSLGGLAKAMPATFVTTLIAVLSISGIPPFNGFVSKWMIYQGIVSLARQGGILWIIWLVSAMFGSALTLAAYMKFTHAAFLSDPKDKMVEGKETSLWMLGPIVFLALLCVLFGIFAFQLPLKFFIMPVVPFVFFAGFWQPVYAIILLVLGLLIGWGIYSLGKLKFARKDAVCIGGEILPEESLRISGVDFYKTVKDLPVIKEMYEEAEQKIYDPYEQLVKLTFKISDFFKWLHSGLLHTYLAWVFLGLVVMLIIIFK